MSPAFERAAAVAVTRIRPPRPWSGLALGELWRFRGVAAMLALRDVKLRYKQTLLGIGWVVLQPLAAALIFAFVFGRVARLPSAGVPYLLFALAGLLGWQLFATSLTQVTNCLVANAQLVSKVWFPRLALPLSTVPVALLDFAVGGVVLAALLAAEGAAPPAALVLLPVWTLLLLALGLGLGLFGAALAVSYRDVQRMLPVATQLLLYASPVAYSAAAVEERVPPAALALYLANPLAPLLEAFRWSLLGTAPPPAGPLAAACAVALLLPLAGALYFQRSERRFADVI